MLLRRWHRGHGGILNKKERLLLALAAGETAAYSPVQVQKLLFLLEENVGERIKGDKYTFSPYDYGPFDASVYGVLKELESDGFLTTADSGRGWKRHALTDAGLSAAQPLIQQIESDVFEYIQSVSEFVRKLSFSSLVSSIYKAYPDMKKNSVFNR
jgi:uncharacterized protein YwgA